MHFVQTGIGRIQMLIRRSAGRVLPVARLFESVALAGTLAVLAASALIPATAFGTGSTGSSKSMVGDPGSVGAVRLEAAIRKDTDHVLRLQDALAKARQKKSALHQELIGVLEQMRAIKQQAYTRPKASFPIFITDRTSSELRDLKLRRDAIDRAIRGWSEQIDSLSIEVTKEQDEIRTARAELARKNAKPGRTSVSGSYLSKDMKR